MYLLITMHMPQVAAPPSRRPQTRDAAWNELISQLSSLSFRYLGGYKGHRNGEGISR